MPDLVGQRLGQYEITGKLGSGGMATVYRARQGSVARDVAIKVIESRLAENPEFLKRFEREARTIAALNHPHILKLFDFGQQSDLLYLVMELQPGGSLADLMRKGALPLDRVSRLLEQIASALDYAHEQGIIHRDLKPQNVLLDTKGNAILTDFGIAKVLNETTALTASGMSMGTPAYMSPEQCQGRALDGRADIYSLGIMLFEVLTGEVPFKGDTPVSMAIMHLQEPPPPVTAQRRDLPLSVEKVINKALAKNPTERFQSAGDLAAVFKIALTGQTPPGVAIAPAGKAEVDVTAPRPILLATETVLPSGRRGGRTGLLAVGTIVLVALVGVLLIALSSGGQNANPTVTAMPTLQTQVAVAVTATQTATIVAAATLTPTIPTDTPQPTLTVLSPSWTVTPSEESNVKTLAAQTIAAKATWTAQVMASYTKTPTNTPTPSDMPTITPNKQQTLAAIVAATETANAIASFTKTPTPTYTATLTATLTVTPTHAATLTPTLTSTPTATLGPPPSPGMKRTDEHGIAQVYVPAGCFMMGSDPAKDSKAQSDEQPQHQVCITQGYWIDAYEVTNAAYQQFIDAGGYTTRNYWSESGWLWKSSRTAPDDCGSQFNDPQQPRVCVSWYEAEAYTNWRGGRLPTEAEWEYAARGPDSLIYPWGNTWNGSKANTTENNYEKTKSVGSYESGRSWVGAYDLAGNAWEWVADWYGDTYYQQQAKDNPAGPGSGQYRGLRGGAWFSDWDLARAACRNDRDPAIRIDFLGFREVEVGGRPPSP